MIEIPSEDGNSDEVLRQQVIEQLTRDGTVDASGVEVDVDGGIVTLRGEVIDRAMLEAAKAHTEKIQGVHRVQNELLIAGAPFEANFSDSII